MAKFKVGDRIVVSSEALLTQYIGHTGEVVKVFDTTDAPYYVLLSEASKPKRFQELSLQLDNSVLKSDMELLQLWLSDNK